MAQAPSLLHVLVDLVYSRDDTVVLGVLVAWYSLLTSLVVPTSSLLLNAPNHSNGLDLFDLLLDAVLHVVSRPYAVRLVTLQAAVDVLGVLLRWSSNTIAACVVEDAHAQHELSQQRHEAQQRDAEWALRRASDGLVQMIK